MAERRIFVHPTNQKGDTMKQTILYSFCVIIIFALVCVNANQSVQQPDNDGPIVLHHFGNMLVSFFELLKDPKNPDHALTQVGKIAQGMMNIGQVACKRGKSHYLLENELMTFFNSQDGQLFLQQWNEALIMQTRSIKIVV